MNKDFDNIFKSKLEQHESAYPSSMWDAIDKEINPPKKDRGILLFSVVFIALLLVSFLVWNELNTTSDSNKSHPLTQHILSNQENSLAAKENNTSAIVEVSNENNNAQRATEGNVTDPNNNIQSRSSGFTAIKLDQEVAINNNIISENRNLGNIDNEPIAPVENIIEQEVLFIPNIKKTARRKSITFTQPMLNSGAKHNSAIKATDKLSEHKDLASSNASGSSIAVNRLLSSPTLLSNLYLIDEETEMEEFKMKVNHPVAATDCPSWVNQKLGLYLEIYGAPEYAISALTPKQRDSSIVAHQEMREATESARVSYSLGGRLLFLTPSGISFKIGLNYSQINEKFDWVDPETVKYIVTVDEETKDTISAYTEYGSEFFKIANSYKSLDIPILIGFEKYSGSKFSLSANAGIYVNVLSEQRGMFIDPTGTRNWFSSSEDVHYKAYKNSVGISFFGSLGMMYHWVEGIDIFVEPSVRYYSQSMSLNSYPLNHRFVSVGVHTGFRYRF